MIVRTRWQASRQVLRRVIASSLIALIGVSVLLARGASPASAGGQTTTSPSKPTRVWPEPLGPQLALDRTQDARYAILRETAASGVIEYEIDNPHGRAESWIGQTISLIQIGKNVYAPKSGARCYISAKRATASLPNIGGMLLPSGDATLRYTTKGRRISWRIKSASRYQPHGQVVVSAADRIVKATIHSGPGAPLTAVVMYPKKAPKISAPRTLC